MLFENPDWRLAAAELGRELLAHDHAQAPAPAFSEPHAQNFELRGEVTQYFIGRRMEAQRRSHEIDQRRRLLQSTCGKYP